MRKLTFSLFASRVLTLGLLAISAGSYAQTSVTPQAGEYAIIGDWPGDQIASHLIFDSAGGWIVWQDNVTDGDGMGISARRLDANLSGDGGLFRVNQVGAGQQEHPKVAVLNNGGAAFVWQGGQIGFQKVFARFMAANGTFVGGDFMVNAYTNQHQIHPSIASLNNGNVVVTWSSYGQDGSMLGIYAQLLSNSGAKIGNEFRVNQTTNLNQRSSSVAALANGNFVVTWASEKHRIPTGTDTRNMDVQIVARVFNGSGAPVGAEFVVSGISAICANPTVTAGSEGFYVAWSQNLTTNRVDSWDISGRAYDLNAVAKGPAVRINTDPVGDQYIPAAGSAGTNYFVVWTSLGKDTSYEGVYGRFVGSDGVALDTEALINTTTVGKQLQPCVAGDDSGRFLVAWSSFVGGGRGFDLYGQRFAGPGAAATLPPPSIPRVSALSGTALSVTWPELAGYTVAFYELYVDGSASPVVVNGIQHTVTNLAPSSTHSFKLLYQLTGGERSPLSGEAFGTTWGADNNGDGLPDDWQAGYWGNNPANWPNPTVDSDGDGASDASEFYAGTDPTDAGSVLRTRMHKTQQGFAFSWNTQPGLIYQVQRASSLGVWQNVGTPRFAHGLTDSLLISNAGATSFYRVIRLR